MKLKFKKKDHRVFNDTGWVDLAVKKGSGSGESFIRYRAKNGFCTVIANNWDSFSIPAYPNNLNFGPLPKQYRPSYDISTCGTLKSNQGYELQMDILRDGTVSLTNLRPGTSNYFGATITYPYDEPSGGGTD